MNNFSVSEFPKHSENSGEKKKKKKKEKSTFATENDVKQLRESSESQPGDQWHWHAKSEGLALRVQNGQASFYVYKRLKKGRPLKKRLDATTIREAKSEAREVVDQLDKGIDPIERERLKRAPGKTFQALLDNFIEYAEAHKKSVQQDKDQIKRYLQSWQKKELKEISHEDIKSLHRRIGKENGPYAANRLLSLIHTAYSPEIAGDLWTGPNPAHGIGKHDEEERERFLTVDELPRLFKALKDEPNITIRDFVLVLLLTGARRSNAAAMKWSDIDIARGIWRIPASESKNGKTMPVALVPQVLQILESRRHATTSSEKWVFPTQNAKQSKSGHIEDVKTTWKAILKRAKIEDFRLHDLRRSLGSWMAMSGASLPIIGKQLGHKSPQSTQIYARIAGEALAIPVQNATAQILQNVPVGLLPEPEPVG